MRLDPDQESTLAFIQVRCKGREAMRYRRVHIHPQEYGKSAINCPCYSAEATNGLYTFVSKTISIREDLSPAQMVKTLVHEIAHALLHDEQAAISDRQGCELEAESVAYVVTTALGIDSGSYSFGYIASWAKDSTQFEKSAQRINRTAHDILSSVERHESQQVAA